MTSKEKKNGSALKKLPVGLASIALGTAIMYAGATNASADEVNAPTNTTPTENQAEQNAVLPGTAVNKSTSETPERAANANTPNSSINNASQDNTNTDPKAQINKNVNMTYYVHDDDDNDKVVYKGTEEVNKGEKIDFSSLKLPSNYVLSEEGTATADSTDFKTDVHAKHQTVELTKPAPVLIQRIITIHNPDNSIKNIRQEGYYQSPASVLDQVTKQSKAIGQATLTGIDKYVVPVFDGYTPSQSVVPAMTAADYDKGAKLLVDISYQKKNDKADSNEQVKSPEEGNKGAQENSNNDSPISNSEATPDNQYGNSASGNNVTSDDGKETQKSQQIKGPDSNESTRQTSNGSQSAIETASKSSPVSDKVTMESTNEPSENRTDGVQTTQLSSNTEGSANGPIGTQTEEAEGNSLPQTGNDLNKELAAMGLGTLGIVGTFSLAKKKKENN